MPLTTCISLPSLSNRIHPPKWSSDHLNGFRLGLHIFHSLRRFLADIGNGTPIHLAQGEPTRGKNRCWLRHRLEYKVWRWMTHKTIHNSSTCNFATHTSPIYKQQTNLTSTCQQQKSIFLTFLITWTSFKNDGAIVMALRVAASVGNLPPWHHRRCRADWNAAEACLSHRLTVMG